MPEAEAWRPTGSLFAVEEGRIEPGQGMLADEELIGEEELWNDDEGGDRRGWFCVRTEPVPVPGVGCTFVAEFMTAAHLMLVWEERDDPNLLRHAQRAKEVGRNPRVVGVRAAPSGQRVVLRVGGGRPARARRPRAR